MPALTPEQQRLVEDYLRQWSIEAVVRLPRVVRMRRALIGIGMEPEDISAHALVGVVQAAAKFDLSKGASFATYAEYWIRSEFTKLLAASRRDKRIPPHLIVSGDDAGIFGIWDILEDRRADARWPRESNLKDAVGDLLAMVPDRDRMILKALFGIGCERLTDREVGAMVGVTKQRIDQIKHASLWKIRRRLGDVKFGEFVSRLEGG